LSSSFTEPEILEAEESKPRRALKILAVTLRYPPYVAGGYELLTEDAVAALRERGHRVHVLAGRGDQFDGQPDVLPWLEPGLDGEQDMFAWARATSNAERFRLHFLRTSNWKATRRALAETGADVLFFFNLGLVSLAPILAARCQGVPTLGYIADLWPLNHWVRDWQNNAERVLSKPTQLKALASAWRTFRGTVGMGRMLVPSEFVAKELAEDGLEPGALEILPLGMAPSMAMRSLNFQPLERAANEPLRVICSSMMWSGKGQHVLLSACALAAARGVNLALVLAGSGPDEYVNRLKQQTACPELAGRVTFAGMLDGASLSAQLRQSHVFALPSLWGEPFGLATLESMAHGLCPLVSDSGASPEIVRHEVDGLVFESGSAEALANQLERLAGNDSERMHLAQSAGQRVRTAYNHSQFIDRVEDELESVCLKGAL
jgi:glycosyltransferase involved in cell wall biosynthesis